MVGDGNKRLETKINGREMEINGREMETNGREMEINGKRGWRCII